jgi:ketosteroid isomerase-like protein
MSNLEQIQELYGAFGRGEIEPVLAALAPDVEWVEGDIEGLPYRGVHRGPEAVGRDVFAQMPGAYESFELVPQEWVGRESSQSVAHVWKFQDGKVTRFESFQDTLATARVLGAVG